jgi:hypothetical protein
MADEKSTRVPLQKGRQPVAITKPIPVESGRQPVAPMKIAPPPPPPKKK